VLILEWNVLSSDNVKVYITPQEFTLAGIDPQSTSPGNIKKLRRYLIFLLTHPKISSAFALKSDGKLLIEIYPDQIGGAEIHFIFEQKASAPYRTEIYCFDDSQELIEAAVKLFSLYGHRLFKSSLYQRGSLWLLIIQMLDESPGPTDLFLSEYGSPIKGTDETAALIEEHCKPILKQRAADTISFYFS